MYKYCNQILKHVLPTTGLEPSSICLSARRPRLLGQSYLPIMTLEIKINIPKESYYQTLLKLQAITYKTYFVKDFDFDF